ncbi:MAG: GNAT family N-acetyltransferase [Planctomycetes bacterium]|nr:GNAT family N-acetyltransferase [Planctomycetota bacterium]
MTDRGAVAVRVAGPADAASVARFIRELARYERLEHQLDLDEARLREHLAGPQPACSALLAELAGQPVGFALFFASYSTFRTRPCLWLEDLFVLPEHRGRGIGLQLLRAVAGIAVARGCPRLDWNVLDWNTSAIGFYERHGARVLPDWRTCRLDGDALSRLAAPVAQ